MIRHGKCHDCSKPVQWMVSKSGAVYYNCYNSDDKGTPCQAHHRIGGHGSRDLRRAFLVKAGKLQPTKIEKPTEAANSPVQPLKVVSVPDAQKQPQTQPAAQKKGEYDEYGF